MADSTVLFLEFPFVAPYVYSALGYGWEGNPFAFIATVL